MPTWAKNNWQATANSKPTPQDLDDIGNSIRLIGLPDQAVGSIQINYNSQDIVNLRQLVFLSGVGSLLDMDHGTLKTGVIDLHNYIKIKHDASPNQYLAGPWYDANNLDFVHSTTGFASHNHLMSLTPTGNLGLGIGGPVYRIHALLGNLPNAVNSFLNALSFFNYSPNADSIDLLSYRHTDGAVAAWTGAEWRLRRLVDGATEICAIYFDAWKMKFRAQSLEKMTVSYTGVGFNRTNPSGDVDINGGSREPASSSATGTGAFIVRKADSVNAVSLIMGNNDNYSWIQSVEPGITHRNLCLQPIAANVGINTTTPNFQLSFGATLGAMKLALYDNGTANNSFGFGIDSNQLLYQSAVDHVWKTAGVEKMRLQSLGNLALYALNPALSYGAQLSLQHYNGSGSFIFDVVGDSVRIGWWAPGAVVPLHINTSSHIYMPILPASPAGLTSGGLWRDAAGYVRCV